MAEYAHPEALVDTDYLAAHAKDANVRVFEVDVDTAAYAQGHVDGAIGLDWRADLQQRPARDIPSKQEIEALLSRHGVKEDSTILLYGDNNNWFAAFACWVLKYSGHKDVRILNGGRRARRAESGVVARHDARLRAAYTAWLPSSSSIRSRRLYFATRSVRHGAPVLI